MTEKLYQYFLFSIFWSLSTINTIKTEVRIELSQHIEIIHLQGYLRQQEQQYGSTHTTDGIDHRL